MDDIGDDGDDGGMDVSVPILAFTRLASVSAGCMAWDGMASEGDGLHCRVGKDRQHAEVEGHPRRAARRAAHQ